MNNAGMQSCGCLTCFGDFRGGLGRRRLVASAIGLAACLPATGAGGQTLWGSSLANTCSYFPDAKIVGDIYTFQTLQQAKQIVTEIVAVSGLKPNFEILQANVPNAAAVVRNGQRFILYSQVFIDQINAQTATQWAAKTIMAHEVGHHLNGHTLTGEGSRPPTELEADEFAGFVIGKLNGPLDGALAPFKQMGEAGSQTHPPRSARLEAVTAGWHKATGGTVPNKPPTPDKPNPTTPIATIDWGNPVQAITRIIQFFQQGQLPPVQFSPHLQQAVQQQFQYMVQGLQMRGQIMNVVLTGQQQTPTGGRYYAFQVMFQNGAMMWQAAVEPTGVISGLYGQ